jgi:hypothetical protein
MSAYGILVHWIWAHRIKNLNLSTWSLSDLWWGTCKFHKLMVRIWNLLVLKGHFAHEPRAMTMKFWEPERKCPKAIPRHFQNHVLWLWWCSVKSYVTGTSTNANLMIFHSCGPHTWQNIINWRLWDSIVPWSPDFVLGLPPGDGFWKLSKRPWNMIHLMPRKNPCRLYIHLAFTHSTHPSSIVWNKLGSALLFPPEESPWSAMVTGISLICEVAHSTRHLC